MADTPPYSEATVDLVVFALPVDPDDGTMVVGYDEGAPRSGIPQWGDPRGVARTVLDALAAAGRLLPEGAETVEEWRVTGDPGGGFPPYEFVWSPQRNPQLGDSGHEARGFVDLVAAHGGWPDGPHLSRRIVANTPWSAVPPEPKEGT